MTPKFDPAPLTLTHSKPILDPNSSSRASSPTVESLSGLSSPLEAKPKDEPGSPSLAPEETRSHRIRFRFAKRGDLRLISHHDLMRTVERMLRRAEIPMACSQGFNPRPKIVFALALGLGIEGHREVLDLELKVPMNPEETRRRIAAQAPAGLEILEAVPLLSKTSDRPVATRYSLRVPLDRQPQARSSLKEFLASDRWPYSRRRPDRAPSQIDLRPSLLQADIASSGSLEFRIAASDSGGSARPEEILEALGLRDLLTEGAVLVRSDIELGPGPNRSSLAAHGDSSSSAATASASVSDGPDEGSHDCP